MPDLSRVTEHTGKMLLAFYPVCCFCRFIMEVEPVPFTKMHSNVTCMLQWDGLVLWIHSIANTCFPRITGVNSSRPLPCPIQLSCLQHFWHGIPLLEHRLWWGVYYHTRQPIPWVDRSNIYSCYILLKRSYFSLKKSHLSEVVNVCTLCIHIHRWHLLNVFYNWELYGICISILGATRKISAFII